MNDQKKNLQELIEEDRKERLNACIRDLNTILKKYNCELTASAKINPDGTIGADAIIKVNGS